MHKDYPATVKYFNAFCCISSTRVSIAVRDGRTGHSKLNRGSMEKAPSRPGER